jgi:hypothetical protein
MLAGIVYAIVFLPSMPLSRRNSFRLRRLYMAISLLKGIIKEFEISVKSEFLMINPLHKE